MNSNILKIIVIDSPLTCSVTGYNELSGLRLLHAQDCDKGFYICYIPLLIAGGKSPTWNYLSYT